MVGAQVNVAFPEVADGDQDAKEVIAFSKSFAGKVEEARDLVSPEPMWETIQHQGDHSLKH